MSDQPHRFIVCMPPDPKQREAWLPMLETLAYRALPKLMEVEAMVTECEPKSETRELSEFVAFLRGKTEVQS